jgi:hypothetical protein
MLKNIIGKKKSNTSMFPQKLVTNLVGGYKPNIKNSLGGRNLSVDRSKHYIKISENYNII